MKPKRIENPSAASLGFLQKLIDSVAAIVRIRSDDYVLTPAIRQLDIKGERITARVQGSLNYKVRLDSARNTVECDCPAPKPCKHIIAVARVAGEVLSKEIVSNLAEDSCRLKVRFTGNNIVEIAVVSPEGHWLPLTMDTIDKLQKPLRQHLQVAFTRPHARSLQALSYAEFAKQFLPVLAQTDGIEFYFGTADAPTRCAGVVTAKGELREADRYQAEDKLFLETHGFRYVRFFTYFHAIEPVTGERIDLKWSLSHPIVKRAADGSYFYVICAPKSRDALPPRCDLLVLQEMPNNPHLQKWQHALSTMATFGPRLVLSVYGIEHETTGRFSMEASLEIAYARDAADLRDHEGGAEIADGAKPIFTIALHSPKYLEPETEIVEHKTGVLILRRMREEMMLVMRELPVKTNRKGKLRIAKTNYQQFFAETVALCKQAGILVRLHNNIVGLLAKPLALLEVKGSSGIDWFEGRINSPLIEEGHLPEILRAYRKKEEWVKLKNGNWLSVQGSGIADVLKSLDRLGLTPNADGTIGKISFAQLASLEAEKELQLRTEAGAEVAQQKFRSFIDSRVPKVQPAKTLKAKLRHYQLEGFRFLLRLYQARTGGILADDMGLGKTVQAIAAMDYLTPRPPLHSHGEGGKEHLPKSSAKGVLAPLSTSWREAGGEARKFIVICPLAALGVWESEIQKFSPKLSVYRWHGPQRSERYAEKAKVILTTFGTFSLDAKKLCAIQWTMAFIDEAQFIKNFRSRAARELRKLSAESIICLTGTPLENYLEDLWALFDLIFPGYLGTAQSFKDAYGGHLDLRDREGLLKKIRPFMLRRRKADVLTELPEKTEMVVKVPMTREQAKVYEAARQRALSTLGQKGSPLFDLLRHLTSLRRIACHPYLEDEKTDPFHSGKFEYLDGQILELSIAAEGVLVFSQYTSVLRVFKQLLQKHGIEPLYLDGQTSEKSRRLLVEKFQQGGAKFFLISLKAGGTALTLTRADTVIHLDPWWNPAVENQATDRAHRIGQKKRVIVYKLISEGTVEEKVLTLQAQKRELFNDLIDDSPAAAKRISRDDIGELLR